MIKTKSLFEKKVIFLLLIFDRPGERSALVNQNDLVNRTSNVERMIFKELEKREYPWQETMPGIVQSFFDGSATNR